MNALLVRSTGMAVVAAIPGVARLSGALYTPACFALYDPATCRLVSVPKGRTMSRIDVLEAGRNTTRSTHDIRVLVPATTATGQRAWPPGWSGRFDADGRKTLLRLPALVDVHPDALGNSVRKRKAPSTPSDGPGDGPPPPPAMASPSTSFAPALAPAFERSPSASPSASYLPPASASASASASAALSNLFTDSCCTFVVDRTVTTTVLSPLHRARLNGTDPDCHVGRPGSHDPCSDPCLDDDFVMQDDSADAIIASFIDSGPGGPFELFDPLDDWMNSPDALGFYPTGLGM
jgi:hypothetical protein